MSFQKADQARSMNGTFNNPLSDFLFTKRKTRPNIKQIPRDC